MCLYECMQVHTYIYVRRSEDNIQESVLPTWLAGLAAGSFVHWSILLPLPSLVVALYNSCFVTPFPELWRSNVSALRAPGFTWDSPCCPQGDKAQSVLQIPSLTWKKNMAVVKVSETPSNLYPADSVLLTKTEMPLK